ncbi:YdcF family protein [Hoeflea marina]|uniref:YdcF family protein n=1 Tax=Hoeflea marina TaxID=274592 RepID=UPI001FE11D22|nr:YdcF family protein [Hoeflea marina]
MHYALKTLTLLLIGIVALGLIGFFRFTDRIATLSVPADTGSVEAIVALTGGYQRIDQALELLEDGIGQRLLISGVNPATSGPELQRVTGANGRMFACCVDIGYEALDTIGNANETAHWIREKGYRRVLVVTNNYHMPRSLLELAEASPDVTFLAYPVSLTDLRTQEWLGDPIALRTLVIEYFKYSFARLRSWSGAKTAGTGLRADAARPKPRTASVMLAE